MMNTFAMQAMTDKQQKAACFAGGVAVGAGAVGLAWAISSGVKKNKEGSKSKTDEKKNEETEEAAEEATAEGASEEEK